VDLSPDLGLRDATRQRLRGLRLGLPPSEVRVRDMASCTEVIEDRAQRPCSTQETGILSVDLASTRTLTFRMRFCLAPTSSSPSYMSTRSSSGFSTTSSGTVPASSTSVTRSPRASASSSVMYSAIGSRRGKRGATTIPRCSTASPSWMWL
jgi:hypothetical protein